MADWDTSNPTDTSIISQFPANERAARSALVTNFGVNHRSTNDADVGKHTVIQLLNQTSDPSANSGEGKLYAKQISGQSELMWRSSTGSALQLTSVDGINASILTSGTLSDSRLSSNVPLKNAANTFTAVNTFNALSSVVPLVLNSNHSGGPNIEIRRSDTNFGFLGNGAQMGGGFVIDSIALAAPSNGRVQIGLQSSTPRVDITSSSLSLHGPINCSSSATEVMKLNRNDAALSFYNTSGSTRRGFIQAVVGGDFTISSEESNRSLDALINNGNFRVSTNGGASNGFVVYPNNSRAAFYLSNAPDEFQSGAHLGVANAGSCYVSVRNTNTDAEVFLGAVGNGGYVGCQTPHDFHFMCNGISSAYIRETTGNFIHQRMLICSNQTSDEVLRVQKDNGSIEFYDGSGSSRKASIFVLSGNNGLYLINRISGGPVAIYLDNSYFVISVDGGNDSVFSIYEDGKIEAKRIYTTNSTSLATGRIHFVTSNVSLPNLSAGQWVEVINDGGSSITVSKHSSDTAYWTANGTSASTFTVPPRGRISVICSPSDNVIYVSGDVSGVA